MNTDLLNWRELRRELLVSPPRTRTSQTFRHTDIFGAKLSQRDHELNNPTNQSGIGRITHKTPQRARVNGHTPAPQLDESASVKHHLVDKYQEIKTLKPNASKNVLLGEKNSSKENKFNLIKRPDHDNEWFFDQCESKIDAPKSFLAKNQNISISQLKKDLQNVTKGLEPSHKTSRTEKIKSPLDSSRLNLFAPSQNFNRDLDRSYNVQRNTTEMRLKHNESNVFNDDNYSSKLDFPIFKYKKAPIQSERSENMKLQKHNPAEINSIKALNHNFSDVFGLEYGSLQSLQDRKKSQINLSSKIDWNNNFQVIIEKPKVINSTQPKIVISSSTILGKKSYLSAHSNHERPILKSYLPSYKQSLVQSKRK